MVKMKSMIRYLPGNPATHRHSIQVEINRKLDPRPREL